MFGHESIGRGIIISGRVTADEETIREKEADGNKGGESAIGGGGSRQGDFRKEVRGEGEGGGKRVEKNRSGETK